jgi:hypothetical protein
MDTLSHISLPLLYFITFVKATLVFAFFATAVSCLGFQVRMLIARINVVPLKTVSILFGATFILAGVLGVVFMFLPYEIALIAASVTGAAAIAWKTPIDQA